MKKKNKNCVIFDNDLKIENENGIKCIGLKTCKYKEIVTE